MRCSKCGAENPASKKFCDDCGVPPANLCPKCGTDNPSGKRFCGDCGACLDSTAPERAQVGSEEGSPWRAAPPYRSRLRLGWFDRDQRATRSRGVARQRCPLPKGGSRSRDREPGPQPPVANLRRSMRCENGNFGSRWSLPWGGHNDRRGQSPPQPRGLGDCMTLASWIGGRCCLRQDFSRAGSKVAQLILNLHRKSSEPS